MCKQALCQNEGCGKKTWWGCGKHIDQVMDKIPGDEQCHCAEHNAANPATSWFQGILGSSGPQAGARDTGKTEGEKEL